MTTQPSPNWSTLTITALATASLFADVTPNPLFSDGAVLQRDHPVPVWGTARDGEKVTVEFENQKLGTTAADGKWNVTLKPLKAGGPFTMTLSGDNVVTVKDLLVGDVWLCSGQSNMHFRMSGVENSTQEIAAADDPALRFFNVPQQMAQSPITSLQGTWQPVSPQTAGECSAVAYYFGRELQRKLGVPVGLLISSVGGTRIESWMRAETLAATGQSADLIKKWSDISPGEFKRISADYVSFQFQRDRVYPKAVQEAKTRGAPVPPAPVAPKIRTHDCPSALHNGMIAPLQPFAIRGAIWYQGESNSGQPGPYQKLLPAMIGDWRQVWGKDLPFLFVQLAAYRNTHPAFREAQHLIWQNTPRTAMVVTTDVGNAANIHPTRKRPVGERLALAARALSHGENIVSSGPIFKDLQIAGNRATLSFTHEGRGLIAKGGELQGFTLAGADGKFLPASAEIQGNTVIVTSDQVTRPAAVRYNWAMMTEGNLFNREDLPAAPFRTDRPTEPSR
ncbi:sialate O-acetylesterase [bacterium]|nr:sialate O-acetylesterase [bacterium]